MVTSRFLLLLLLSFNGDNVWCRFLALAIPGGLMVGLEAWSFDWTMVRAPV